MATSGVAAISSTESRSSASSATAASGESTAAAGAPCPYAGGHADGTRPAKGRCPAAAMAAAASAAGSHRRPAPRGRRGRLRPGLARPGTQACSSRRSARDSKPPPASAVSNSCQPQLSLRDAGACPGPGPGEFRVKPGACGIHYVTLTG